MNETTVHTVGLTTGPNDTWATYCVECSHEKQEWVPVAECRGQIMSGVPFHLVAADVTAA